MIQEVINILMLEDSRHDQELIKRQVKKAMPNALFTVASDKDSFLEKIKWTKPQLILSDYHLPDYNGLDALLYAKEHMPDVPFIFLSGNLSDEEAVAGAILSGASAYVLKQNLNTIPEKVLEIYKAHLIQQKEQEDEKAGREKIYVHLQKANALLEAAGSFQNKAEVLHEIQQAMKKYQALID